MKDKLGREIHRGDIVAYADYSDMCNMIASLEIADVLDVAGFGAQIRNHDGKDAFVVTNSSSVAIVKRLGAIE